MGESACIMGSVVRLSTVPYPALLRWNHEPWILPLSSFCEEEVGLFLRCGLLVGDVGTVGYWCGLDKASCGCGAWWHRQVHHPSTPHFLRHLAVSLGTGFEDNLFSCRLFLLLHLANSSP